MTDSTDEQIPSSVIEAVLKRLEIAGPLHQDTGSLCRAIRQGIATEMRERFWQEVNKSNLQ
jgi:hypothetical protein